MFAGLDDPSLRAATQGHEDAALCAAAAAPLLAAWLAARCEL